MSGDLISRSAVIKIIEDEMKQKLSYVEHNAQIDILFKIKEMPTAYDVDRVVERLKEEAEKHLENSENDFGKMKTYYRGIFAGYRFAVEEVKEGGASKINMAQA